jgi:hypothetical protein
MDEPLTLDKQPTEVMPVVKPPTMNSLILDRMQYMEGTVSDGFYTMKGTLTDAVTFTRDIEHIKLLCYFLLVVGLLCLAEGIYIITAISILFGRTLP